MQYTPDEWDDLSAYLRPHAEDTDGTVASWAKSFIASEQHGSVDVISRMLDTIGATFSYQAREAEGTQQPGATLQSRSGTCRDYAWLMIEALRRIGFACRFVSGYIYNASLDAGGPSGVMGSGATHAWVQVYLPGAGWLNYDPTNRLSGGFDLIRPRSPSSCAGRPLAGIVVRRDGRLPRHVRQDRDSKSKRSFRGRRTSAQPATTGRGASRASARCARTGPRVFGRDRRHALARRSEATLFFDLGHFDLHVHLLGLLGG